MRVADVRPDHRLEDIERGQGAIDAEVGDPAKTVMIVRRDTPDVSLFVDRASTRSDVFPWRGGVWVKHRDVFRSGEEETYFAGHPQACAVILDLQDRPTEWLSSSATLFDIEQAWLRTEAA